ncbi:MAG: ABC-2 transporter permease [Clostridiales bacterium]|nr:ABC-2 transporter permease [Clostridiales bacterium]
MKGLMIKDLINLKQQVKIVVLLNLLYLVTGIIAKDGSAFSGSLIILTAIIPLTAFSCDAKVKWDRYAITMPLSRKDLVLSKYALYLIINLLLTAAGLIGMICIGSGFAEALSHILMVACVGWIYISFTYPLLFHFGVEKASIFMMILVVFMMFVFVVGSEILPVASASFPVTALYTAIPFLTIAIIAASIALSFRIVKNKDY